MTRLAQLGAGGSLGRSLRLLPVLVLILTLVPAPPTGPSIAVAEDLCAKRYVAGGDDIPAGQDIDEEERYPNKLRVDHLNQPAPGAWCLLNTSKNDATSSKYISDGQLATTWNMRPDFITLTIGRENTTIVDEIDSCFKKVRDHDFTEANVCFAMILANESAFTNLKNNLVTIFQGYRFIMYGRPWMIVAVTTVPNPYAQSTDVIAKIPQLCIPLIDTIPTCAIRWAQYPIALTVADQVIQKLNKTIYDAYYPFFWGTQGRFQLVDIYPKFKGHCMEMKVTLKTEVEHPEQSGAVHKHDSPEVNMGCDNTWFVKGDDGTKIPEYLNPAALGVLINKSQTTKGMGVRVNADGQKCIADQIWEWDTPEPGVTPLKWKLNYPEQPNSEICN
jgi:hypothetical protein